MTKTPRTAQAVVQKILKPLRPDMTAPELYDALPGLAGSGGLCGLAVAETWSAAFSDDGRKLGVATGGMLTEGPSGSAADLLAAAFATYPSRDPAPGTGLYLETDERGVFEPEQECLLYDLLAGIGHRRRSAVLVDVVRDGPGGPVRPWRALALVDNDRGRHLMAFGGRRLWWVPGSVARLAEFVDGRVPEHV